MSNFTMDDLKKRIEEQTVLSMGALMPEEALKKLVDDAIENFFKPSESIQIIQRGSHWDNNKKSDVSFKASPFEVMVWEKVKGKISGYLDEYLKEQSDEINSAIKAASTAPDVKLLATRSIIDVAPVISQAIAHQTMHCAVESLRDRVRVAFSQHGLHASSLS